MRHHRHTRHPRSQREHLGNPRRVARLDHRRLTGLTVAAADCRPSPATPPRVDRAARGRASTQLGACPGTQDLVHALVAGRTAARAPAFCRKLHLVGRSLNGYVQRYASLRATGFDARSVMIRISASRSREPEAAALPSNPPAKRTRSLFVHCSDPLSVNSSGHRPLQEGVPRSHRVPS